MDSDNVSIILTAEAGASALLNTTTLSQAAPGASSGNYSGPPAADETSLSATVLLSLLFSVIFFVGIAGNVLVIVVILRDFKMRQSVTNLMIINLAVADLVVMVFAVPEMVMFVMGGGWLLGPAMCKFNRYLMTSGLYSSVLSLLALCIERFIAIVFPFKAQELCTRWKVIGAIVFIWPVAFSCGLPIAIYNAAVPRGPGGDKMCVIRFPEENRQHYFLVYKFTESAAFYFIPMLLQIVLYSIIARQLFASTAALNGRFTEPQPCKTPLFAPQPMQRKKTATSDTIRARKGVVKMLISSVLLYCVSYSPFQVRLVYKSFIAQPGDPPTFLDSMEFFVFVMVVTHINSAANPVLYAIFSQNFRRNFQRSLCCGYCRSHDGRSSSLDTRLLSRRSTRSSSALGRTVATTM